MARDQAQAAERVRRFGDAAGGVIDRLPGIAELDAHGDLLRACVEFEEGLFDLLAVLNRALAAETGHALWKPS